VQRMMSHAIEVPGPIWLRLNHIWIGFFIAMGLANLYVASGYWSVESQLQAVSGMQEFDLKQCAELFNGQALELCNQAQAKEEQWVNFKLFGMMGLTLIFVLAQAFYLARHVQDEDAEPEEQTES